MIEKQALRDLRRKLTHRLRHGRKSWTEAYLDAQARGGSWAFIHINKCGGTSVEQALDIPKIHDTARDRRDRVGPDRWAQMTTFSIVRHPVDRVMSLYRYRIKTAQTGMADRPISIDDWIRAVFAERDPAYHDKPLMFLPARAWLVDEDDRIIVDFVARLEQIGTDWPRIQKLIGTRAELPRANTTVARANAAEALSPASRDTLAAIFDCDFRSFDYTL